MSMRTRAVQDVVFTGSLYVVSSANLVKTSLRYHRYAHSKLTIYSTSPILLDVGMHHVLV